MEVKIFILLSIAFVAISATHTEKAPLLACDSPTIIKDEYIVVLQEELSDEQVEGHKKTVRKAMQLQGNFSNIRYEYKIGKTFKGYSIVADPKLVDTIRTMSGVKYVEHNQIMSIGACKEQQPAEWGLFRTIDASSNDDQYYTYNEDGAGEGVDVYIIDTGIYLDHEDFAGRAIKGVSFISGEEDDGNGHGTHVAGTVIGVKFGIAKEATAIPVKVLKNSGFGSNDDVINGVKWTAEQHNSEPKKKSVANMSLGGGASSVLDEAVEAAIKEGVHFAIAAGNDNANACNTSPARAPNCVTVGAITNKLEKEENFPRAYFSNYGECVDIFAPGSGIESAWIGEKDATNTISGTSMAAPHVAGVIAKILSELKDGETMTPKAMKEKLQDLAEKDKVINSDGPNLLLQYKCPQ